MLSRRRRLMWLVLTITVGSATAGWAAGSAIRSPADAAGDSRPPEPSAITAPVEHQVLASTIVTRGDGRYSGSTELVVDVDLGTGGDAGRPVVTGRLPREGDELSEGAVALEVSGRPVFLLEGRLPMYRALGPGSTGADVRQLEQALDRLGYSPGRTDEVFDDQTSRALDALYLAAGYQPGGPAGEDGDLLAEAEQQQRAAEAALADAEGALADAARGPARSELLAAESEVELAAAELEKAIADRTEALAGAAAVERERLRREHDLIVLRAERQLAIAEARWQELTAAPDTTREQAAVDQAGDALAEAREAVASLRAGHGTTAARGEVIFLPDLPRRVEEVHVGLGDEPAGPVLTVSGTELVVETRVTVAERQLLAVGVAVRLDEEALGIDLAGRIVAIGDASGEGVHTVLIRPEGGDAEQLTGVNLRVTIPVESTDGQVLAVPTAAVTTTVDGTSWVRVLLPDGGAERIEVRVGLAADGLLEVTPVAGGLEPGDEVVLGLR